MTNVSTFAFCLIFFLLPEMREEKERQLLEFREQERKRYLEEKKLAEEERKRIE